MEIDKETLKQIVREILIKELPNLITQDFILPDVIKQRHVSEGIRYIRAGLAANRPTSGTKNGEAYFATDTDVLSLWNGSAWRTETFT